MPCRLPQSQGDDSWSSTLQTAKWHRSTVNPHPDPFTWTPTWADWNVTNNTDLFSLSFSALLNCLLFKNTNSVFCTQVLMISQWKQWAWTNTPEASESVVNFCRTHWFLNDTENLKYSMSRFCRYGWFSRQKHLKTNQISAKDSTHRHAFQFNACANI